MVLWTKFIQARKKIVLLSATVVGTYYIKLFRARAGRQGHFHVYRPSRGRDNKRHLGVSAI